MSNGFDFKATGNCCSFQLNYDLCLWKDVGGLLDRFQPENTYLILDAPERMYAGALYTLVWYRDEYEPEDDVI